MHRIEHGKSNAGDDFWRPIVFLQHDFLGSSADFVIQHHIKSLGFILADHGYDVWIRSSRGWKKSARNYCGMFFWHNFVWRNRIHCPFNVLNLLRCPKNRLKIWPKIQRIFKIYKGKKYPTLISIVLVLSNLFAKIGWTGVIAEVQTVV